MFNRKWLLFFLIIFLAAFLRFFRISTVPPSLDWDEAAIGWNAKTIFHTRRDEYGTRLPLAFQSFGDYKAPLYIYLTAPVIGILGTNEIAVRWISVFAGIGSVVVVYYLASAIFKEAAAFSQKDTKLLALISGLLLAVSPWHLMLSRPAFEPNLALFLILTGSLFFMLGLKRSVCLVVSTIFFALSFYAYHSPKIFVPIFVTGLVFIFRKEIFQKKNFAWLFFSLIVGLVFLLPLVRSMFSSETSARFQGTSIFYTKEGEKRSLNLGLISQLSHNYFIHYSPSFLFFGSDASPRIQMRQIGPLLLIQAPFLLAGLIFLIKNKKNKSFQFLLWWFATGPVAASIGFEVPHPIRAFNILPALTIITSIGFLASIKFVKKIISEKVFFFSSGLLLLINLFFFLYHYFYVYPVYAAPDWQYGYKQVAEVAKKHEGEVDKVILTSHYGQPYIFILFYQNRDPQGVFWGAMSKYLYREIKWQEDLELKNTLLIGTAEEIPEGKGNLVSQIDFPSGEVAFRIIKTDF